MGTIALNTKQVVVELNTTTQQNFVIEDNNTNFEGYDVIPRRDSRTDVQNIEYDAGFFGEGDTAEGQVTITVAPTDGQDLTINGLVYTAKTTPVNPGDFEIGGTTTVTADNLKTVINDDTRTPEFGGQMAATSSTNVVTIATPLIGTSGQVITMSTANTPPYTLSGANFTGGDALTTDFALAQREIILDFDLVSRTEPAFFTAIVNNNADSKLIAIPKYNKNGNFAYDLFWGAPATGIVNMTLVYGSVEVPEGVTPTFQAHVDNVALNVRSSTFVLRHIKGTVRVYDWFYVF